ncbi:hypothetical protein QBB34_00895 [Streptomyces stelliscabiei]
MGRGGEPGRREIIGRVPASGASDVGRAVAVAKEASRPGLHGPCASTAPY